MVKLLNLMIRQPAIRFANGKVADLTGCDFSAWPIVRKVLPRRLLPKLFSGKHSRKLELRLQPLSRDKDKYELQCGVVAQSEGGSLHLHTVNLVTINPKDLLPPVLPEDYYKGFSDTHTILMWHVFACCEEWSIRKCDQGVQIKVVVNGKRVCKVLEDKRLP